MFQVAGATHWKTYAITQSASDAVTVCMEFVKPTGRFIIPDAGYIASRGPLKQFGACDRSHGICDGPRMECVRTMHFPFHTPNDFIAFWSNPHACAGDDDALVRIRNEMTPGSVIVCELVSYEIWRGCLSPYFVTSLKRIAAGNRSVLIYDETLTCVRTGKLFAHEHLNECEPDGVIFGKSLYLSGVALRTQRNHPPGWTPTRPLYTTTFMHATQRLEKILVRLSDTDAFHRKCKAARRTVRKVGCVVIRGAGLLLAGRLHDVDPEIDFQDVVHKGVKFAILRDGIARFTFCI